MDVKDSDIVISGISGRFPNSNNLREFEYNLFNKVDMTDENESRWKHFTDEIPQRFGKIHNLEKFDASFFSTLNKHADWTDPQMRILLEHAYESILDAGISPQSLVGSKTGVFIGCSISDARDAYIHRVPPKDGYVVLGSGGFYFSNRISYALGLCGPSVTVDTACSSSAYALDCAVRYMETGVCDSALVGGSQVILNCGLTSEYMKLKILAKDGISRPFDEDASGFTRAESICVMFLQRRKDSKRIYANVVYSSSNNDGFKKEGASFPSKIMQQQLIENFYQTIKLDPANVNFVEAHATGTKLGDPEELAAIDEVFAKRSLRSKTLTIGSVKSNMGHAEAASGMASMAKILLAFENQKFPPNINLKAPRSDVAAFSENRIKVATEVEDLTGDFIAMNSFGLGGANAHSLFRGNPKVKSNSGVPDDDLGRMLLWSGRIEAAINAIFDDITQRPLDAEHIALLQNSQIQTTSANTYRGYGMFINDKTEGKAVCVKQNIQYFNGARRPVVFVYSGIGSQWLEMGRDLLKIPLFAQSIEKCHDILMNKGINLKNIITSSDEDTFSNVLHSYVGIVAIEIALTDILKELNIVPDYIIGHSLGELGCAYADNCLTTEETILAAYARGEANRESHTIRGAMAAVGMNHLELKDILPGDIDIACHNGEDSSTISGPVDSIHAFIEKLKEDNIFVKEVACSGVPLHSRYITQMGRALREKLKKIIKEPKIRSEKWLSSTYAEGMWKQDEATLCSADYHANNLLNPVLFQEVTEMLPEDALLIEVAPSGLLRAILKRSLKEGVYVNLTERDSKEGSEYFMEALGQLFQLGVDMDISKLYPPVSFPVSRGTPMISPVIKWNHEDDHFVPYYDSYNIYERRNIVININDKFFEPIKGHIVDGRILFPATGWIFLVWETFAAMIGVHFEKVKVILEDIHFLRATPLVKNQDVLITISIQRGSGRFEIIEGNSPIVNGYVKQVDDIEMADITPVEDNVYIFSGDGFYKEMRLCGFTHLGPFKGVTEIQLNGLKGKIKWMKNWTTFLDTVTHFNNERVLLSRELRVPIRIKKFVIDPILHLKMVEEKMKNLVDENSNVIPNPETEDKEPEILFDAAVCPYRNIISSGGIEIHGKTNQVMSRRRLYQPSLEIYKFIPFFSEDEIALDDAAKVIIQIIIENMPQIKFATVEIDDGNADENQLLSEHIQKAVSEIPQVTSDITLVTARSNIYFKGVTLSTEELSSFKSVDLLIRSKLIGDKTAVDEIKLIMNHNGYIVSREDQDYSNDYHEDYTIIAKIPTSSNEILHIIQFRNDYELDQNTKVIEITSNVSEWLEPLKLSLKECPTIIFAYNQEPSGILGFYKCLRYEFMDKLKCFFIMDTENAPSIFDITHKFFKDQLEQNHAINVFKDGKWGGYRHLCYPPVNNPNPQSSHYFANCLVKGDLSTVSWIQGFLDVNNTDLNFIRIQYSSLNFKDIMLAIGRISDNRDKKIHGQETCLGFEFSGIERDGERVMGIGVNAGALATHYDANKAILWKVPDSWTLEEAATVPLVYFTVYFAFFNTTTIKAGKKILIHSGSGGVGQAAIEVAFAYGLEVFTTVSTEEKKNFLLKRFPKLKPENIGNSRNTTFEKMVLENTAGKGVDYVLNSLSGDRLQASINCLGINGVFLEIGKYDIQMGTNLDMKFLSKRITLKAVSFDEWLTDPDEMEFVYDMFEKDLKSGIIKPLNSTVFDADKIEDAFRYMASGQHIGKVLIRIRKDASNKMSLPISTLNRVYCYPNKSIIITGGLGGFGFELTDWLISRGCKKIILSSSRGIRDNDQTLKIKYWESCGLTVLVSTANISTEQGCEDLIKQALELGPIGAIFHLAAILRDKLFENLDEQMFTESLAAKGLGTKYLDNVSRVLCPDLEHFVVFSSVSCGRGNAGQSNYGMANSIMERIIEDRHRDGFAGKAIQWGAIGDVGMLADFQLINMDMDFGGTHPQSIHSCLEVLDTLLTTPDPIVSSMIVADKKLGDLSKGNIIDMIFKIMGIRDRKSVSMDSTLTQLGIDSLTGVEIQYIIEREFDITLTSQELRSLTLSQLEKRVSASKDSGNNLLEIETRMAEKVEWMRLLMEGVVDPKTLDLVTSDTIVAVNSIQNSNTKILIVPGFFGFASTVFKNIGKDMDYPAYVLQYVNFRECTNLVEIMEVITPIILDLYADVDNFILIGHSYGCILTLKMAEVLELDGKTGQVIQLDGSPILSNIIALQAMDTDYYADVNNYISMMLFKFYQQHVNLNISKTAFESHSSWTERFKDMIEQAGDLIPLSHEYMIEKVASAYMYRLEIAANYENGKFPTLKTTKIALIKATKPIVKEIPTDYGLSKFCNFDVIVKFASGDHVTLLLNSEISEIIKEVIAANNSL
ncbi:fatty acid synthase-like [Chironomus tepperi]|uniref:fatty acid synthase-like n=1 Tax=Chironomus tepperi TaxID=113505 RepID=UPI00391F5E46